MRDTDGRLRGLAPRFLVIATVVVMVAAWVHPTPSRAQGQELQLLDQTAGAPTYGDALAQDYTALAAQARNAPSEQVGYRVAVLADGYTAADQAQFYQAFQRLLNAVGGCDAIAQAHAQDVFWFFPVFVASPQRGATHRSTGYAMSTAFGSTFQESTDTDTTITADFQLAWAYARSATAANPHHVIVLVNDPQYGGTNWSTGVTVIPDFNATQTDWGVTTFEDLVRHEFVGHGFAGLADEYVYSDGRTAYNAPNCDTSPQGSRWGDLIGWQWLGWSYEYIGAYAGCTSADAYRPTDHDCKMNDQMSMPFCAVCARRVLQMVQYYRAGGS